MSAASDVPEGEVIAKCQRLPRALGVVIYLHICESEISMLRNMLFQIQSQING